MKDKLKEGQVIYLKPIGNAARYNQDIREGVVSKVSRKYFEVKDVVLYGNIVKFEIDSMMHYNGNLMSNYKAYLSKQEILDEIEKDALYQEIFNRNRYNSYTLDQYRKVAEILEIKL